MTSLHRLIAIAVIWIAIGGALVVLYQSLFLTAMPFAYVLLITAVLSAAAAGATYFIARTASPQP